MRKLLCNLCLSAALGAVCWASPLPKPLADRVELVEKTFSGSASTAYKVQLMAIAPGVFIDPPPDEASFANVANVVIGVDALSGYDFMHQVMVDLRASNWVKMAAPGYPRWYWRIIGPSGNVVINLLIDEENTAVGYAGDWYTVDQKLVNRLTREFVELTTKTFLPASKEEGGRAVENSVPQSKAP